jgi:DNA-binding MarR family transcriptional regulator
MKFHVSQGSCYNFQVKMGRRDIPEQPSLPYLIHRIARRLESRINRAAKADGLRIEGIRILLRLLRGDHQRVGDLAESTSIEQSALSHMLRRMETDGFVTRGKVAHDDSRTVVISLAMLGRRMAKKYAPMFQEFENASLEGLSLPERRRLKEMLIGVYERVLDAEDVQLDDSVGR